MNKGCLICLFIFGIIAAIGYVVWDKFGGQITTTANSVVAYELEKATAQYIESNPNPPYPADNAAWAAVLGGDGGLLDENPTISKLIKEGQFLDASRNPLTFSPVVDGKVKVTSSGADGIAGTADDVNSDQARKLNRESLAE